MGAEEFGADAVAIQLQAHFHRPEAVRRDLDAGVADLLSGHPLQLRTEAVAEVLGMDVRGRQGRGQHGRRLAQCERRAAGQPTTLQ